MVQPVCFGGSLQFDERRVADRFDDVFVYGHVREILPVLPNQVTSLDRHRAKWKRLSRAICRDATISLSRTCSLSEPETGVEAEQQARQPAMGNYFRRVTSVLA